MNPHHLLERLIDLERRVYRIYCTLGDYTTFQAGTRFFWKCMAEDEQRHLAVLQRSTQLLDLVESAPSVPEEILTDVEAKIEAAEIAVQSSDIPLDDAFHHALVLESSELNRLDETWFQGFEPAVGEVLRLLAPGEDEHLRRLVEAVQASSDEKALHDQATQIWIAHHQRRSDAAERNPLA